MIEERKLMRRAAGYHDFRLDGMTDVTLRARGASVLDIGCNRGGPLFEMFVNGAELVHGVDIDKGSILVAREWFYDFRNLKSRFEVVDVSGGDAALGAAFGDEYRDRYDIIIFMDIYHKLSRVMAGDALEQFVARLGERTGRYFCWRGYGDEKTILDRLLAPVGLRRVHYSEMASDMNPAGIWARV